MTEISEDTNYIKYHDLEDGFVKEVGVPFGGRLNEFTILELEIRLINGEIEVLEQQLVD